VVGLTIVQINPYTSYMYFSRMYNILLGKHIRTNINILAQVEDKSIFNLKKESFMSDAQSHLKE
jgi:hypothetical protein